MYNNAKKLYKILLSICNNDCNNIADEEEKRLLKNMILVTYFIRLSIYWIEDRH